MKRNWMCGIELGSEKIRGVIGRIEGKTLSVFGVTSVESEGLTKGVVTDIGDVSSCVKEVIERLEFQTKLRLEGALLGINGCHLECQDVQIRGFASDEGKEVTSREIKSVLQQASSIALPMNRRLLHALLQGYIVDGQEKILNPIGMYAHQLGVQLKLVTGTHSFVQNAMTSLNRAGIEVEGVILSGYTAALATLEKEEKNSGSLLLDLGSEISSLLTFENGGVSEMGLFPIGGSAISEKIAETFEIPFEEAEKLKRQYGALQVTGSAAKHELLVNDGTKQKVILKKELCDVIRESVQNLFERLNTQVSKASSRATLILVGGASLLEGVVEEAGSFFQRPSRLGKIRNFRSSKNVSLPYASAMGLIWYGHEKQNEKKVIFQERPAEKVLAKVRELFLDYF